MLFSKRKSVISSALLIAMLSALVLPMTTLAHNKVVVIPMAGDDLTPLSNIITVAKENGDFTDPVAAMASITDASDSNRYLIVIAPGEYTLATTLIVKNYVSVAGSGEIVTKLVGSIANAALVDLSRYEKKLSDIHIQNNGESGAGVEINVVSSNVEMDHVSIVVGLEGTRFGIDLNNSHKPRIHNVTIKTDSSNTFGTITGIHSRNSSSQIENLDISFSSFGAAEVRGVDFDGDDVSGNPPAINNSKIWISLGAAPSTTATGIADISSNPVISSTTITIPSSGFSTGIDTDNSSSKINNVTISVNGNNVGVGIQDSSTSTSIVRQSWVEANTYPLSSNGAVVSYTSLVGGLNSAIGTPNCVFSDDGDGNALNSSCQ